MNLHTDFAADLAAAEAEIAKRKADLRRLEDLARLAGDDRKADLYLLEQLEMEQYL